MTQLKYRMVVSDFDGTLLRSDNTVSPYTRAVINKYQSLGGIFTVSTGRMHRSIARRIAETGITGDFPLMSFQGALVRGSQSGETLFSCPLKPETALKALRACEESNLYCQYYNFDDVFVPELTQNNTLYCAANRVTPVVVGRLSEYLATHPTPVAKVVALVAPELRQTAYGVLYNALGGFAQVFPSAPCLVEAVSPLAGKHNALKLAAARYGIGLNQVIAVGDEMNDAGMIGAAGLGVAMGNAVDGVKAVAKAVTCTNDEDGVAKMMEEFCF